LAVSKNFTVPIGIFNSFFDEDRKSILQVLGEAKEGNRSRKAPKTVKWRL
jgi:hypothetical protein